MSGTDVGQSRRHDFADFGQLVGGHAAHAELLGLEMHLAEHAEEVQEGRHDGGDDNGLIGQRQVFDHEKGRSTHDRRRDLAAGRRR